MKGFHEKKHVSSCTNNAKILETLFYNWQVHDILGRVVRKPVNANPGLKLKARVDMKAVFWLVIIVLTQISR